MLRLKKEYKVNAAYLMIPSVFLLSASNVPLKHLLHVPVSVLVFYRTLLSIVIIVSIALVTKFNLCGGDKRVLLVRGGLSAIALFLSHYAIPRLPLATVSVIANLSPFVTIAITGIYLKESVSISRFVFTGLSLVGVLLLVGSMENSKIIPLLSQITAVVISSIGYLVVFEFSKTKNTPLLFLFYTNLLCLTMVLPFAFESGFPVLDNCLDWIYLSLSIVLVFSGQYLMNQAYTLAQPARIANISYTSIIYSMLFGYFLFNEPIFYLDLLGAVIVIAGILLNEYWNNKSWTRNKQNDSSIKR